MVFGGAFGSVELNQNFPLLSNTLSETNSSHLQMDGWNTIVSFWGPAYFQVQTVSFMECM